MNYEYSIKMTWHNKESNNKDSVYNIPDEMINNFIVVSDYAKANMPIAYATLTLNKSNIDDIIKNVKTAYFDLSVQKAGSTDTELSSSISTTTPYSGKCVYFIDQDINYNKELDYVDEENDKKPKNAILQTISIGLMWEACIERNKQTNNETIVNSTMFNTVLKFLQNTPLVIEPFDYNDNIDQLIITPKDSLVKTIKFLNGIKVFYSTKYRLFFDPDCTYLLSSSGNGVKKRGEKYLNCLFNVRTITDPAAYQSGMTESKENNCYYVDIHVKDSYYTKDTDTQKVWNEIESIMDPSVDHTRPFLDVVNDAIQNVNKLTSEFNRAIKDTIGDIEKIPRTLGEYRTEMSYNAEELATILIGNEGSRLPEVFTNHNHTVNSTQNVIRLMESYKNTYRMEYSDTGSNSGGTRISIRGTSNSSEIEQMGVPESLRSDDSGQSTGRWVSTDELMIPPEEYKKIHEALSKDIANIKKLNELIGASPEEFSKISGILTGILAQTTNLPGCVNCVAATNMSSNANLLSSKTSKLKSDTIEQLIQASDFSELKQRQGEAILTVITDILDNAYRLSALFDMANIHVQDPSSEEGWSSVPNPYLVYIERLYNDKTTVPAYISDPNAPIRKNYGTEKDDDGNVWYVNLNDRPIPILNMVSDYKNWCTVSNEIIKKVENPVKSINSRVNSLKDLASTTLTSLINIGTAAQKSLDKIVGAAKTIESKVKSLDFDISILPDLKNDINVIKDISKISMLGISSFNINLNLGGSVSTGKKVIAVSNDNANEIKNIQSEILIASNKISITKTDLDTSVFTINKRFVIKNYDAHSNLNGVFIMIKKSDFFTRAGNKFKLSTQIEFAKVRDEDKSSGSGNNNKGNNKNSNVMSRADRDAEVRNLIANANSIITISKEGVNLSNIGSIIRHASSIQQSYERMRNSTPSSDDLEVYRTGGIFRE